MSNFMKTQDQAKLGEMARNLDIDFDSTSLGSIKVGLYEEFPS
jgi:hypothetical protein